MEVFQAFWPFIGLCAGTGALAYFISRAAFPKKCIANEQVVVLGTEPPSDGSSVNFMEDFMTRYSGSSEVLQKGKRRIVHVHRSAITANMKRGKNYPTCVVIEEDGTRKEFHGVLIRGDSHLQFDPQNESANVYLVTNSEIVGIHSNGADVRFDEEEDAAAKKLEPDVVSLKNRIQQLEHTLAEFKKDTEKGYEQAHEIINDLQDNLSMRDSVLPVSKEVNVKKQCRRETKRKLVYNCVFGERYKNVTVEVPLNEGEEGFVDIGQQIKYVRQKTSTVSVVPVPLQEGDYGFRVPC